MARRSHAFRYGRRGVPACLTIGVEPGPARAATRITDIMWSEILSFPYGPMLVAAGSVAALLLVARRRGGWLAWLVGIVVPPCIAMALYLLPMLLHADEIPPDYGAWVVILIIIAAGVGLTANAIAAASLWAWRRARSNPAGR
jgi:hypothetical protein